MGALFFPWITVLAALAILFWILTGKMQSADEFHIFDIARGRAVWSLLVLVGWLLIGGIYWAARL